MQIILKNFEVLARHGVNAEEKVNAQRFLISAKVVVDEVERDDVECTVSYSHVKKLVKAYTEENCFDLIETLADGLAKGILLAFPLAREAEVAVKKPDAPMSGKFDYVAVVASRKWERAYLSLGSSMGDKNAYLDMAISSLCVDGVRNIVESSRIVSSPYGGVAKNEFLNSAVELETYFTPKELLRLANSIESAAMRERSLRWGDRTLDVDILLFGNEVINQKRIIIPHYDMINRVFVLKPLAELNAHLIHPVVKKSIKQLLLELEAR